MHILILPSWYPNKNNHLSGIFFKEQSEALAKYGNKVGLIAINEVSIRDVWKQKKLDISKKIFTENGVNTFTIQYPAIPKLHTIRNKIRFELFKKLFREYIEIHGKPDIVHVHSFTVGEFAIWIKENYDVPYVITEHSTAFARDMISKENLVVAEKVFKSSSYNIAVSNEFTLLLNKKFNVDFQYIPNIVNTDFFEVKEKSTKRKFDFINIAFLDKKKNQDILIKSFTKAFKDNSDVKLTIAGDGPEYDNLNNLIITLDMTKQIKLYGRANREEVKELLQSSDAFVLSSQYETFGVVVIEAMACGLPVVATKCGGPESIVIDEKLGRLVDINIDSLSKGMLELYNKKYDSKYIRNYVIDNFSADIISLKLIQVYKRCLGDMV